MSGAEAARAPGEDEAPLALYITNSTPYFFSHRIALAREVAARGFRIALAGGDVDQHRTGIEAEGILPLRIPGGARGIDPVGDLMAGLKLAQLVRRLRPAVIHATGLKGIFLCSIAGFLTSLPRVVCIVSGLGSTYINDHLRARVLRACIETAIRPLLRRRDTRVIFQNADDLAYFRRRRLVRTDNSLIVRGSGVDIDQFAFTPEPVGQPPLVIFPARLLLSKGLREFVEAARQIRARGLPARFALVGDLDPANPDALSGEELAAITGEGVVEAWGFRSDMDVVLAGCHLVCLPSYREGVPKALIEAASVGRAIVTTDVPGCREIVIHEQNGLVVPARDAGALADALARLLVDPGTRQRMGVAGRALVEADYAEKVVVRQTADQYGQARLARPLQAT